MTTQHDPAAHALDGAAAAVSPPASPIAAVRGRSLPLLLLLVLSACSAPPPSPPSVTPAPLVDGDCGEYPELQAERLALAPGVELHLHQDQHYVWMCAALPPESFGTVDLRLETPQLSEPLNLHVSAQLGEWPADRADAVAQSPDDEIWWSIEGWTANPLLFSGLDRSNERVRPRFRRARARELQLSKARFGHGEWRFTLKLTGLRDADGALFGIEYPTDGSLHVLPVR